MQLQITSPATPRMQMTSTDWNAAHTAPAGLARACRASDHELPSPPVPSHGSTLQVRVQGKIQAA